jgi:hypothetical protein
MWIWGYPVLLKDGMPEARYQRGAAVRHDVLFSPAVTQMFSTQFVTTNVTGTYADQRTSAEAVWSNRSLAEDWTNDRGGARTHDLRIKRARTGASQRQ